MLFGIFRGWGYAVMLHFTGVAATRTGDPMLRYAHGEQGSSPPYFEFI